MASTLQAHLNGESNIPQLRMVVTGEPGTGKSRILLAFLWYAYQHGASDYVAILAYTWRAALQISTPTHNAVTTCRFFGLNQDSSILEQRRQLVQDNLADPLRFIAIDELSFLDARHFAMLDVSTTENKKAMGDKEHLDEPFAGLHMILMGDPYQHNPVSGIPLYKKPQPILLRPPVPLVQIAPRHPQRISKPRQRKHPYQQLCHRGRHLYENFNTVFILTAQYRFTTADDASRKLLHTSPYCETVRGAQLQLQLPSKAPHHLPRSPGLLFLFLSAKSLFFKACLSPFTPAH